MDRVTLSLAGAPFVLAAAAWLTRAPARRIAAAVAGGMVFAAGNVAWDVAASRAGLWTYPRHGDHAPLLWYPIAGLAFAGMALVGWRVHRRAGVRGVVWFLAAFALVGALRDASVAATSPDLIVFGAGPAPWLADAAGWASLLGLATLVTLALGGEVARLRGQSSQ